MTEYKMEVFIDPELCLWNERITALPGSHILQTSQWAQIKSQVGWQAEYLIWKDTSGLDRAACLVLIKRLPIIGRYINTCICYAPRGPLLDWSDVNLSKQVLNDLVEYCIKKHGIFLKIDPDLPTGIGLPNSDTFQINPTGKNILDELIHTGWKFAADQIQFRNTVILDLTLAEDILLERMKQKTRYNISLARRKGVTIRKGTPVDFPMLYQMYATTALRDGFAIRNEDYYRSVWTLLYHSGMAMPLIAEVDGKPVSAVVLFLFAKKAYYFYGMSTGEHRDRMPNHLLQWEAIRFAKAAGYDQYDLWGAPDKFDETDSMWGVYRFKEGFNGKVVCGIGAWDHIINKPLYKIYSEIMPGILNWMRRLGRKRVSSEVSHELAKD